MLQTFLKSLKKAAPDLGMPCTSYQVAPGLALAAASLDAYLFWPFLGISNPSTNSSHLQIEL